MPVGSKLEAGKVRINSPAKIGVAAAGAGVLIQPDGLKTMTGGRTVAVQVDR
jgi:hypothetical protein